MAADRRGVATLIGMSLLWLTAAGAIQSAHADPAAVVAPNRFEQARVLFDAHDYQHAQDLLTTVPSDDPSYAWAQVYLKLCQRRLREGIGPEGAAILDETELKRRLDVLKREQQTAQRYRDEHNRVARHMETASEEREEKQREAWERQQRREAKLRARAQRLAHAIGPSMPAGPAATAPSLPSLTPSSGQPATAAAPQLLVPSGPPISLVSPLPAEPALSPVAGRSTLQPVTPSTMGVTPPSRPTTWPPPSPKQPKPGAVEVQADRVEYDSAQKRVIASGHVVIDYEGARLTGQRAIVYTESKEAYAEGNAWLRQDEQILIGELLHYNLETRHGQVLTVQGSTAPWYFKGPEARQVSAHEVRMAQTYTTTCEFDPPHYRFQARRAELFLDDKIVMHQGVFYVDQIPVFYYPRWTHSLKENQTHVQLIPGKHKQWGPFLLTKWRYELNKDAKGTIHWDWRNNFGMAQGVDLKYRSDEWGDGIIRTYYNESTDRMDPKTKPSRGNRHWLELRHRWQIDPETQATLQFEKFSDTEFRKQFLFRERFTAETTEESYLTVIRSKPNYSLSTTLKQRVNRTDSVLEQLPSVVLNVNDAPIGDTKFFYQSRLSYEQLNNKPAAPTDLDDDVTRIGTFNQLSYAAKLAFIHLTPRVGMDQLYFSKDQRTTLDHHPRHVVQGAFEAGFDASTRFFRIFDVHTNTLGLDINLLRHVINPTVTYNVIGRPTVPGTNLAPFNTLSQSQGFTFALENKLQTKRKKTGKVTKTSDLVKSPDNWAVAYPQEVAPVGPARGTTTPATGSPEAMRTAERLQNVDLARLILSMPYSVHPKSGPGSRFGSLSADLEILPYSWMRLESDLSYDTHTVSGVDHDVATWNMDLVLSPNERWYLGAGQRYSRDDKAELTTETGVHLGKKWTLRGYWRYTFKEAISGLKRFNNLRESQYVISRDLHDWVLDIIYHVDREFGEEIYFVLHWKAFPEVPFETKVSYNQPKYGSQSSPFSPLYGQQAP